MWALEDSGTLPLAVVVLPGSASAAHGKMGSGWWGFEAGGQLVGRARGRVWAKHAQVGGAAIEARAQRHSA